MKCEHCGFEQPTGRFCDNCGLALSLVPVARPEASQGVQGVESTTVSGPLRCISCGHEQPTGKFCDACGMAIPGYSPPREARAAPAEAAPDAGVTCRYCGHLQPAGRFCDECGNLIPVYRPAAPGAPPNGEPESHTCPDCGINSTTPVCRNCGGRVPGF